MKTTIDLPDALARDAKDAAARLGVTLRELVVDGLRNELERRGRPVADFTFTTVDGRGLDPAVDPADVISIAYERPA
jgi:uncharacterized protein (DUF2267 family)